MQPDAEDRTVERFHATNGRLSGYLGLAVAAVVLVLAVVPLDAGRPLGVAILALLGALLAWVVMLRPSMWATDHDLVMRSMLHTDAIPLATIDRVAVGQVTAVSTGDRRYVSPVVGYTARQSIMTKREAFLGRGRAAATAADSYQVFVEERITHLAKEARDHGDRVATGPRRTYAWAEIAGIAVLVVAFLVWLIVF